MAAPVPESYAENSSTSGLVTSLTIDKPTGTASGDRLVAYVSAFTYGRTWTGPAGWSEELDVIHSSGFSGTGIAIYTIVAGGAEPASYTFNVVGGSSNVVGAIFRISGSGSIRAVASSTGGVSTTAASPTVNAEADDLLLSALAFGSAGNLPITQPSGMTLEQDLASASHIGALASESIVSTGATGTRTWTASSGNRWAVATIAIAPAAGGGGTTYDRAADAASTSTFTALAKRTLNRSAETASASTFAALRLVSKNRAVVIASDSTFTAARLVTRHRAALMASASTFAALASVTRHRAAVIASASAFTAAGAVTRPRAAGVSSASSFSAQAKIQRNRAAAIGSASTFTAVAKRALPRAVAISSASAFTAQATVEGQFARSASIEAQSSFATERTVIYLRAASVAGSSQFEATAATDAVAVEPDTHDGQPREWDFRNSERDEQDRRKAKRQSEDDLRRIVAKAVRKANGEVDAAVETPLAKPERKNVARQVLAEIRTDGVEASLQQIERLIREFEQTQRQIAVQNQMIEDEAIALLLLAA